MKEIKEECKNIRWEVYPIMETGGRRDMTKGHSSKISYIIQCENKNGSKLNVQE